MECLLALGDGDWNMQVGFLSCDTVQIQGPVLDQAGFWLQPPEGLVRVVNSF